MNSDFNSSTSKHWSSFHNKDPDTVIFFGIDRVALTPRGGNREKKLMILESEYIILLDSKSPRCLNQDKECFCILDEYTFTL